MPGIGVLCVDDRPEIGAALRIKVERLGDFEWKGWLPQADALSQEAKTRSPQVVLLDLEVAGKPPFAT
jgi:hypothetical protein